MEKKFIYPKLVSKTKLSESEISWMVRELLPVYEEERDSRRWTKNMFTVVEVFDKSFAIDWEAGLTEDQEDQFYNQPYEVEKHVRKKMITVTEWEPVV